MPAMRPKQPIWFATVVGGAIGVAIGLAFGAFEVCVLYTMPDLWHRVPRGRLYALIAGPIIVCSLYGAFVATAASANLFGRRSSVVVAGFLTSALLCVRMGLGLLPLRGPLIDGN